ncbi:helix-turn-helix domain-containing protein [Agrobacterium rhizogenes]|nr:helix-turn-helix domain-containing protein [Rhizobium rhizogenes]
MAKTIHDRIQERLDIMGLNPSAASLKANLSREAVRKLLANRDQLPTGKTLFKLAQALEVSEQWLLTGEDKASSSRSETQSQPAELPLRHEMANDVPVMGTAAGSHLRGAFQLSTDPVDYVRRPPALMNARNIYSLYIEGSSMEPQFWPGDLVFVHPDKPPRFGDAVVIQCQVNGGQMEATIGIYSKRTPEKISIRKHNPTADIEIARETILSIHKVLTLNEIFGI